jgi:hypothetical protein
MLYVLFHATARDAPAATADVDTSPTEWIREMERRGVIDRVGYRLRPAEEAGSTATVRVREGETVLTHGPYAEVQEQVAGYDLIEAADLDEAIEIAARHPSAWLGAVEIRPLWQE